MDKLLAQLKELVAKRGYQLVAAGLTIVTVAAAAWVAVPARRQKAVLQAESANLEAVITSAALWTAQFQPASSEESASWQQTTAEIGQLGVKPSERLTLAQMVARRADEAGFGSAHIKFVQIPAAPSPVRQVGGITFSLAPYKLEVSGTGSFSTLIAFMGELPPAVELQSAHLARDSSSRVNTSLSLSVFEPAGANGK